MQTKKLRRQPVSLVNASRWTAYATAGIATALAGANSAEAAIHYSGVINVPVPTGENFNHSFALDNGASISFLNVPGTGANGIALFRLFEAAGTHMFVGTSSGGYRYPSKLASGANISAGPFAAFNANYFATLAAGGGFAHSKFLAAGTGFIGFRFNGGSGIEYGWARVTMNGSPGNAFTLVDYAWGDTGTAVTAGQTVPEPASLGLLAVGAAGLLLWRRRCAKAAA